MNQMTIREVSKVLGKDNSTIRKIGKKLFPESFKNGITTLLNENQVTAIKFNLGKNSQLPKTELEKELIVLEAIKIQAERVEILKHNLQEAEQKVKMLVHDSRTYTTTEIAKELGFKSAIAFNRFLFERRIAFKDGRGVWVLYSKYADKGYHEVKQKVIIHERENEANSEKIIYLSQWTGLGREWLLSQFGRGLH